MNSIVLIRRLVFMLVFSGLIISARMINAAESRDIDVAKQYFSSPNHPWLIADAVLHKRLLAPQPINFDVFSDLVQNRLSQIASPRGNLSIKLMKAQMSADICNQYMERASAGIRVEALSDYWTNNIQLLCFIENQKCNASMTTWFNSSNGIMAIKQTIKTDATPVQILIARVLNSEKPVSCLANYINREYVPIVFVSIWNEDRLHEFLIASPTTPTRVSQLGADGSDMTRGNLRDADALLRELQKAIGLNFYSSILSDEAGAKVFKPTND